MPLKLTLCIAIKQKPCSQVKFMKSVWKKSSLKHFRMRPQKILVQKIAKFFEKQTKRNT
jgi:hypothetical protein